VVAANEFEKLLSGEQMEFIESNDSQRFAALRLLVISLLLIPCE
jgi:hypothetical protein